MTLEDFWKLLNLFASNSDGNARRAASSIDKHLRKLHQSEVADFARHYTSAMNGINKPDLVEAAYIIGCGHSNDGFVDFRTWVLLQDQKSRDKITTNPDYLGTYQRRTDPIEDWCCEFDPRWTYQEMANETLANVEIDTYPEEPSDFADEKLLASRYPKLWKRCRG